MQKQNGFFFFANHHELSNQIAIPTSHFSANNSHLELSNASLRRHVPLTPGLLNIERHYHREGKEEPQKMRKSRERKKLVKMYSI